MAKNFFIYGCLIAYIVYAPFYQAILAFKTFFTCTYFLYLCFITTQFLFILLKYCFY